MGFTGKDGGNQMEKEVEIEAETGSMRGFMPRLWSWIPCVQLV